MRTLVLILALAFTASAQTYIYGSGSNAARVGPRGDTLPATCEIGQVFVRTGATSPGLYGCRTPNTWSTIEAFIGSRVGLDLGWVDADTISVAAGGCLPSATSPLNYAGGNITFSDIDTGTRTLGRDYAVFLTASGPKITLITTYHASGLAPSGSTSANSCLIGYFHNGKSVDGANALGAIFQYSVTSNDKLNRSYPYRAAQDLPAGVPLPGMVRVGGIAFGIYETSREDATASAAGTSAYPTSRYGVAPWTSIQGWNALAAAGAAGYRLPTWAEWLMAVQSNPGSATGAVANGNTAYGSSSDDMYLVFPAAPTAVPGAVGTLNGAYKYLVTLVNANGETNAGTATGTISPSSQVVDLTVAVGATGTTARKVYRTAAGGSTYKLLTTLADNTTTAFVDDVADVSLGAAPPSINTTGAQQGTADPTQAGRTLTGTGPRTALNGSTAAGRSWYVPSGIADAVGNTWEWAAQFFGGLKTSSPGTGVAWGSNGDYAYNFQGQAYNPDTGGYTEGLPSLLFVGGGWSYGSFAGVRAAYAGDSPGVAGGSVSFRLCR